MNEQVLIQDTLKLLAEGEHEESRVTPDVLASRLAIARDQVDGVLRNLASADLIESGSLKLTASGREYALHVLRAHRLYETYLARKTGVRESQWHARANIEEHKLSAADVEKLARDLDYPRFDPHGDPIPTAAGDMPARRGGPLADYPAGWEGRVVHVEDEPPRLYALIAAASIAPGTELRIVAKDDHELRVHAEGRDFSFPVDVAGQITVVPLADEERFDESVRRLYSLVDGEQASVVRLSPLCRGLERSRLLDLGLVPGTVVSVDLVSPAGSPIAYRIRGASIALRREQAERVLIRDVEDETDG